MEELNVKLKNIKTKVFYQGWLKLAEGFKHL